MCSEKSIYEKVIFKYGETFISIFAIMPDEILEHYLEISYDKGIKELNEKFCYFKDQKKEISNVNKTKKL